METKISLLKADGSEVLIDTEPEEFSVAYGEYDRLKVCVAWNRTELAQDASEYLAVTRAWPGVETLVLKDKNGMQLFSAPVSGVNHDEELVGIDANETEGTVGDLDITVTEDASDGSRMSVKILVDNHGQGGVVVDFGDDNTPGTNLGDGVEETTHQYESAGTYTISVWDVDQPGRTKSATVTVPFVNEGEELDAEVVEDTADETRRSVNVTVDNKGMGAVTIDFGDGSATEANPGDGTTVSAHSYELVDDGTYSIVITDADDPLRTVTETIEIPFGDEEPPPGS